MVRGRRAGDRGMVNAPRPIPAAGPRHAGARVRPGGFRLRLGQCRFGQDPCAGAAGDPAAAQRRAAGENPLHHLHQGRRRQHGGAGVLHPRPLGHARRRRARRRDRRGRHRRIPIAKLRMRARELFASRAGDAGRAEGADHPRAVHAAAAAVSVRGQCAGALRRARRPRPDRDDGARQSRGAARRLARSRQRRPGAR